MPRGSFSSILSSEGGLAHLFGRVKPIGNRLRDTHLAPANPAHGHAGRAAPRSSNGLFKVTLPAFGEFCIIGFLAMGKGGLHLAAPALLICRDLLTCAQASPTARSRPIANGRPKRPTRVGNRNGRRRKRIADACCVYLKPTTFSPGPKWVGGFQVGCCCPAIWHIAPSKRLSTQDSWALGLSCPESNCPPPKSGQLCTLERVVMRQFFPKPWAGCFFAAFLHL